MRKRANAPAVVPTVEASPITEIRDVSAVAGIDVVVTAAAAPLRQRIARALDNSGIGLVAAAADPGELPAALPNVTADVAVVACEASERSDAIEQVISGLDGCRVVVIGEAQTNRGVLRAVTEGADGFVLEAELESTLAVTVRAVSVGQIVVPANLWRPFDKLTLSHREKQVLGLVVMGLSNGEIASKLYLAESTVKSHLSSAFGKLGVRSRSEAATMILDPAEGLGVGILTIPGSQQSPRAVASPRLD